MTIDLNLSDLRRLDLNLILVFAAVIETGTAKAAAKKLGVGSSAISMALARLRAHVGDALFVRTQTGLLPTRTALAMYRQVRPALTAIDTALADRFHFDPATTNETFKVALVDDFELWMAPGLERRIRSLAPNASLSVRGIEPSGLREALESGRVDVVVAANPVARAEGLPSEELATADFVVLANRDAKLPKNLTIDEYVKRPHALASVEGSPKGIIDAELERRGFRRKVVLTLRHFSTLPFVLADGSIIATLPRSLAQTLAPIFDLEVRELPLPSPTFSIGMIWHPQTASYPASLWIRQLIRETVVAMTAEKHTRPEVDGKKK